MDVPRTQRLWTEITQVECDGSRSIGPDGGGEHVAVFGGVHEHRVEGIGCADEGLRGSDFRDSPAKGTPQKNIGISR